MAVVVTTSETGGQGKTFVTAATLEAAAYDLHDEYDAFVLAEANAVRSTLRVSLAPEISMDWPTAIRAHRSPGSILQRIQPDWLGVDLLPGPLDPAGWVGLTFREIRQSIITLVHELPRRSWIHFDTGQVLDNPVHAAAVAEADLVIVVTSLSNPRVEAMEDWWRSLDRFREEQCPPDRPRLTIAVALRRSDAESSVQRRLETFLSSQVPLFTMAPTLESDPFASDSLPLLAGQVGADMQAIAKHIHRTLKEPARVSC